jgi:hypothetical protein
MQAKKGDILEHHFSHDPKDILQKGKCTYSDETYRHKLAKDILQRIKEIKVPTLYKYPPQGIEGKPYKIKDAQIIKAHTVRNELSFYEDENGEIAWGRNIDFEEDNTKHLLIRPDVAFFDHNDKPILLIEIFATHKIDDDKLFKIMRLKIDTVTVSIPKDSPTEIENTFYKTDRTKWVYNYEQEQIQYIRISSGDGEGIPPIDEFQRRLLKAVESYSCRAAQIRNIIRGITKVVESEPYKQVEADFRGEIERVAKNAEGNRGKLRNLQEQFTVQISGEFREEEKGLRNTQDRLIAEYNEWESKYLAKREELDRTQREYQSPEQAEIDRIETELAKLGSNGVSSQERIRQIAREQEEFRFGAFEEEKRIDTTRGKLSLESLEIDQRRANLSDTYARIEAGIREEFERYRATIIADFEAEESRIREEFERDRRESIEAIENRDSQRIPRINRRIKEIVEAGRHILSIEEGRRRNKTYERAKELFDSGAYKNWS